MPAYVALLRAVNVGGTGALPMARLRALCEAAGSTGVRTHIASGNAVFRHEGDEARVRAALAGELEGWAGAPVGVLVRTAAEMAGVVARNPFGGEAGSRVVALFTDGALPADPLEGARGHRDEAVRLGQRELFIHYPRGQADTRLRLPAMAAGTARNMNTVARLAGMAAELEAG